ncbi:MAG: serine/threonine protein kinase [Gammaproteobacteria bacterium]
MTELPPAPPTVQLLKRDLFGSVSVVHNGAAESYICRDVTTAPWWTRPIARALARREARTLSRLDGLTGVPQLLHFDGLTLHRSYMAGEPMQVARPQNNAYFRAAQSLVFRMHRRGVVHNDTAKEPNWLVLADGSPGLIDFQLALCTQRRGRWFALLAREDIRHLLKHKRTYAPAALTARQQRILNTPAWTSRIWRRTVKPVYLFVTRRVLNWSDREGATDRGARSDR